MYLFGNYLLAFMTSLKLIKRKEMFVYLLLLIFLYFAVIIGVQGLARYRLPFMPFINILCAAGFFFVKSKFINWHHRKLKFQH